MPDFEIVVRVNDVTQDDADGLAWAMGLQATADPLGPSVGRPQRVDSTPLDLDRCPHCPDGHQPSDRRPWAAWVTETRDGDGQPTTIHVARSDGAHVAEQDAAWIRDVLNGRAARGETRTEFGVRVDDDGAVIQRQDRLAAETTLRSIRARGGTGTLVSRTVTVTDGTDIDTTKAARLV